VTTISLAIAAARNRSTGQTHRGARIQIANARCSAAQQAVTAMNVSDIAAPHDGHRTGAGRRACFQGIALEHLRTASGRSNLPERKWLMADKGISRTDVR
jgi:hypothetical protein